LNLKFNTADTTSLNLTSRFAAKQNTLNGTGFVKTSGTNITYDNSSYLRTGLADSSYLKLTGGTLTGALNVNGTSTLNFTNVYGKNTYVPFNVGLGEQSIFNVGAYLRGGTVMIFPDSSLAGSSGNLFFANSNVLGVEYSARGSGIRNYIKQGGDVNRNSLALYTSDIGQQNTNRLYINFNGDIGINDDTPSFKLDVNGTLGVTNAATLSSTLAVTGAVTLSTTSATPTSLLGKDGSNVVGTVTTVEQTGLFGRGSVTNAVTDSNGNITVAHGFNFTPIMAFANLPGQTINIVNVKSVDNNNIVFVVRDGPTNDVLNTISVAKIEFFAIK
jgi:CRISPR-associated DxTHG motif protein